MNFDFSLKPQKDVVKDMIFDDDSDQDSKIPYEVPQEVRKLTTQAYDKSVADVVRMIEDKDIRLDPDYQRNYVWDNKKSSLLIESIILNVPIPVIYVSQEQDDTWSVIDGLQRLYSLKRFFEGKFKLSGLEILSELNKHDINSLNPKALRLLKNGLLRVIMITHDSNEEIKYDVFMRLNTGSVHLNEQELTNNVQWQTLLGLKAPHKRMADRELILRFLAIYHGWNIEDKQLVGYKGRMKVFLNEFMSKNHNTNTQNLENWKLLFNETVEKIISVYGEEAFRRINREGSKENSINRAIIDILMLSSTQHSKDDLLRYKEQLNSRFLDLILKDDIFNNSLKIGTSDSKVITYRLTQWCSEVNNIVSSRLE